MRGIMTNMLKPAPAPIAPAGAKWHGLPVTCVADAQHLAAPLLEPDIDAAIWTRALPPAVTNWLASMAPERWPQGRYVLRTGDISACLESLFAAAQITPGPELSWICKDVTRLGQYVRRLVDAPLVRLRLEPVFDNACSKLHIDNVVARMICTYTGPGTELGLAAMAPDSAVRVDTGAPILLKGKRWPGRVPPTLRHRSPPISATGEARLVVVLEGCTAAEIYPQYDQRYLHSEAASKP